MSEWQMQEAKNKLSEVVDTAITSGAQILTRRGRAVAVVLSWKEYQSSMAKPEALVDFLLRSPLVGSGLAVERDQSPIRQVAEL